MFRKQKPYTEEWQLYEQGKEYHYSIGLYDKVNTNERFYRGDQWEGVQSGGLGACRGGEASIFRGHPGGDP